MGQKLLTVAVPVYNMDDCLGRCLDSLLVSDPELLEAMEVFVVNDGSTDGTSALAHAYEARYPGVFRVIDKENGNSGSCVNAALALATGKYFRQLDADDYYDTAVLEQFLPLLREREEDLISTPHRDCFPGRSHRYDVHCVEYGRAYPLDEVRVPGRDIALLTMHSLTYRTDLLRSYGHRQQEGIYYTDVEQCYFATAYARDIYFSDLCLYQYVFGREGQSVTFPMYSKHRDHLLKVSLRLVRDYVARVSDEMPKNRRVLLANQALESVKPVYYIYLLADVDDPDFRELDRLVRSDPEFNAFAEAVCLIDGIPYVKLWHINGLTPHFIYACSTF